MSSPEPAIHGGWLSEPGRNFAFSRFHFLRERSPTGVPHSIRCGSLLPSLACGFIFLLVAGQSQLEEDQLIAQLSNPTTAPNAYLRLEDLVLFKGRFPAIRDRMTDPAAIPYRERLEKLDRWKRLLPENLFWTLHHGLDFRRIVRIMEEGPPEQAHRLLESFSMLPDPGLVPMLETWRKTASESLHPWIRFVEAMCGDTDAVRALVPLIEHPSEAVYGNAYVILYNRARPADLEGLRPLLKASGPVRQRAFLLLSKHDPASVRQTALQMLRSDDPGDRLYAARVLSQLKEAEAGSVLLELASSETNPAALSTIGNLLLPYRTSETLAFFTRLAGGADAAGALVAVQAADPAWAGSEEVLLAALSHTDGQVADASIAALLRFERARWIEKVRGFLGARGESVRGCAAEILARVGDRDSLPAMEEALTDSNPVVQRRSLEALASLDLPRAREAAVRLVESPDPQLRLASLQVLFRADRATAIPWLREAVRSGGRMDRAFALRALQLVKDSELEELCRLVLWQPEEPAKIVALAVLAEEKGEQVLPLALSILRKNPQLSEHIVSILERHYSHPDFLPFFLKELQAPNSTPGSRFTAILWCESLGGEEVIEPLRQSLRDADVGVKVAASIALCRRGHGKEVADALVPMAADPKAAERPEFWTALGMSKQPEALDLVKKRLLPLFSSDPNRKEKAARLHLACLEGLAAARDPSFLPFLRWFLFYPDAFVRDVAAYACAVLGDECARRRLLRRAEEILSAAASARPSWIGEILGYLGELRAGEARALLGRAIHDPETSLRFHVIAALQEDGSDEARRLLVTALDDPSAIQPSNLPPRFVREQALRALCRLTRRYFRGRPEEQIEAFRRWWTSHAPR